MNPLSRKEVRRLLKAAVTEAKSYGLRHTLLCMIISHGRGKLHCMSYKRYQGGWRVRSNDMNARIPTSFDPPEKMLRAYGPEWAGFFWNQSLIRNLSEQAECIRAHLEKMEYMIKYQEPELDDRLRQAARQIIGDLPAEEIKAA